MAESMAMPNGHDDQEQNQILRHMVTFAALEIMRIRKAQARPLRELRKAREFMSMDANRLRVTLAIRDVSIATKVNW